MLLGSRTWFVLLAGASAVVQLAGCEPDRPPPPPRSDASVVRDAGRFDARVPPRRDAGPAAPIVDGELDDPQWEDAIVVEGAVETDRKGSVLERLRALVVDGRLYLAIEGTLAADDALIAYIDGELEGEDGVADFTELADDDGVLDERLSEPLAVPPGFAADLALGTTLMPRVVIGLDEAAGWRDVAADPATFVWLAGEDAPLACSSTACEASVDLSMLPGEAPREIGLFVRIATPTGLTNQTLPDDDPTRPQEVSMVLRVMDGELPPLEDAGVPDAGVDAGVPSVPVVDGTIGAAEWAGAFTAVETRSTDGTPFAGNALRTLRALRTSDRLYVAIEGQLTAGNAILMYVDARIGDPAGVATNTNQLMDGVGALDRALSSKSIGLAPELLVDFAWGVLDMSRAAAGTDDRMGWREVGADPFAFSAVSSASAPTVCSSTACETSIPLTAIGAGPAPVGLFVRLGGATSELLSNQTLPPDLDAEFVVAFVELDP